ncbi:MAG: HAMP domain-containing histidine kinase [Anaerolineaceae bacterium]|nr:HAMP domain-containing histidine kinase [Anaerolineaceae bacterium]
MTMPLQPALTFSQAQEVLNKLQSAAPPATAEKLAQVLSLMQSLSEENAYLNTLILEQIPGEDSPPPTPASQPPVPEYSAEFPPGESEITDNDAPAGFLSGVTDALRPPLIAIRGRAELVQDGLLGQITPEQDQWLQAIRENTNRAFAMLDAIEELIALQAGQVRLDWVSFISTDLLKEAWERVRDMAREHHHDIIIQAPDVVPLAHGDFYQSLLVLTDLLDNAIRYTPDGGQIRLSVDSLGTHVLFSVADNGIGLTLEDLKHVSEPFWRGDHHRMVRQHTGTGLRLYLAKQILALQSGELIFSGEPDLGSTFSFTLCTPE